MALTVASFRLPNFVTGIFLIVPALVTIVVLVWTYGLTTEWAIRIARQIPIFKHYVDNFLISQAIRLASLLFMLLVVFVVGMLARNTFGKKMIDLTEWLFLKMPMINVIYSTVRNIGDAVRSKEKGMFRKVVLLEYPRHGIYCIGFVTNENNGQWEIGARTGKDLVSVFLPTTPNPTSGFLLLVPRDELIFLDIAVADAMRLVISGGAVSPMPWTGTPPAEPRIKPKPLESPKPKEE